MSHTVSYSHPGGVVSDTLFAWNCCVHRASEDATALLKFRGTHLLLQWRLTHGGRWRGWLRLSVVGAAGGRSCLSLGSKLLLSSLLLLWHGLRSRNERIRELEWTSPCVLALALDELGLCEFELLGWNGSVLVRHGGVGQRWLLYLHLLHHHHLLLLLLQKLRLHRGSVGRGGHKLLPDWYLLWGALRGLNVSSLLNSCDLLADGWWHEILLLGHKELSRLLHRLLKDADSRLQDHGGLCGVGARNWHRHGHRLLLHLHLTLVLR